MYTTRHNEAVRVGWILLATVGLAVIAGCSRDDESTPPTPKPTPPRPGAAATPADSPTPAAAERVAPPPVARPTDAPDIVTPDISMLENVIQDQIGTAREALAAAPNDAAANGRVAMLYHVYGLRESAVVMYQRAAAFDPTDYHWPYYASHCLATMNQLEPAIEAIRTALDLKPDLASGWAALGFGLIDLERYAEARDACEKARTLDPDAARPHLGLGRAWLRDGHPAEAIAPLRRAVALSPYAGAIHRELAQAMEESGDTTAAESERVLGTRPLPVPMMDDRELAELFALRVGSQAEFEKMERAMQRQDAEAAIRHADKAIKYAPESLVPRLVKASILFRLDRKEEALAAAREAVDRDPDNAQALCVLADALQKIENNDDVADLYERALAVDPDHPDTLMQAARFYAAHNDLDTAEKYMHKSIEVNPANLKARSGYVDILLGQGRKDKAFEAVQSIVEQWPMHGPSHQMLAMMLTSRGDTDAAIFHYRCAIEASPDDGPTYVLLSQEYEARGQYGLVEETLTTAIERVPESHDVRNALAWLRATCPDPLYRNGREAIRLARELCRQTNYKNPSYLDTLAAAYAEIGEFEVAAKTQQKLIDAVRAANRDAPPDWVERLNLYQAGKKYRSAATP